MTNTQAGFVDPVNPQRLLQANAEPPTQLTSSTKQIIIVKTAVSQQDYWATFWKNGRGLFDDLSIMVR
jgi:hypothetical protein